MWADSAKVSTDLAFAKGSMIFISSYVFLCLLVLTETLVLLEAITEAALIAQPKYHLPDTGRRWHGLLRGTRAPEFSAYFLNNPNEIRKIRLLGHPTALVFVSPDHTDSTHYMGLSKGVHLLWRRLEGNVFLVCSGETYKCRDLLSQHIKGFPEQNVIADKTGEIAWSFRVSATPQAIELDENGQVEKYGLLESTDSTSVQSPRSSTTEHSPGRSTWPDDRPISGAGFARMNTTISCVVTRFRLNSPLAIVPFYLAFRRVRTEARQIQGFLETVFLLEDTRTFYTMSLWENDSAILEFGNTKEHVKAANSLFSSYSHGKGDLEVWSAQFRLWAVSPNNFNWPGLNLQHLLGDQWDKRNAIAALSDPGPGGSDNGH